MTKKSLYILPCLEKLRESLIKSTELISFRDISDTVTTDDSCRSVLKKSSNWGKEMYCVVWRAKQVRVEGKSKEKSRINIVIS